MTTQMRGSAIVVPNATGGPHAAYVGLLEEGTLGFQGCASCRASVFPPRTRCPRCGADSLEWRASSGAGTVYSTTVISARDQDPYSVVLVDVDEGYRMMSRVDGEVAIGDRVRARLVTRNGAVLPFFESEGEAS